MKREPETNPYFTTAQRQPSAALARPRCQPADGRRVIRRWRSKIEDVAESSISKKVIVKSILCDIISLHSRCETWNASQIRSLPLPAKRRERRSALRPSAPSNPPFDFSFRLGASNCSAKDDPRAAPLPRYTSPLTSKPPPHALSLPTTLSPLSSFRSLAWLGRLASCCRE